MVERFAGRIVSEVLAINVYSHRALEQLLRGFKRAYSARRKRVLGSKTPSQCVAERFTARSDRTNPTPRGRAGLCDATEARLIVDRAKEVPQPES